MAEKRWIWLLLAAVLGLCAVFSNRVEDPQQPEIYFEEPVLETLQPQAQSYHRDDTVFSVTLEDYIRCFNSLFQRQFQSDYFPDSGSWDISHSGKGIHTHYPVLEFRFSEDPQVFSLPTVTVHTPMEEHRIQELIINFDEHSYTQEGYRRYRLLCADTLNVFLPELSREAALALCDQILELGNEHVFSSQEWYTNGALPYALFYKGNVGVYSYDAIGDWRHFCVIPLTRQRRGELEEKGVILYEMETACAAAVSASGAFRLRKGAGKGGEYGAAYRQPL